MSLLSNLKILDFSTLLPGPFASMMLADLGADVLRVESPTRSDLCREMPPFDGKHSTAHAYLQRSKRSLALDLKKPGAAEVVKRLVQEYDIVLEQFRPGVMDRLGVGYEALKAANPKLIYCSITGYGQTGPYKDRAGHDMNYLSIAGISDYTRRKGQSPLPLGIQVADIAGGSFHAVMGILAAVIHRQATGEGQAIDISMTDAAFSLNALAGAAYLAGGIEPKAEETLLNGGAFYDYYQTRDGRYFSVGSLEPQFLSQLCEAIGHPELTPLGLSANPKDQATLKAALTEAFAAKDYAHWQQVFAEINACVEPVLSFKEAVEHPQIQARELVVDVPKGEEGVEVQQQLACPIKFSRCNATYRHTGCDVGEHNRKVLNELGYSESQIQELKTAGVLG